MEEGTPSPTSRPPLPRPPSSSSDKAFSSAVVHGDPAPLTYIVQVPKDQIYRIPPKENAILAEQYLASLRKHPSPCVNFLLRFLCIFIAVALPLLIAALIFYVVTRPIPPIFNVDRVSMEPSKTRCEVFMAVTNPSIGTGYSIEGGVGRAAKLSYKGKVLADGEPPIVSLKAMTLAKFELALRGAKKAALAEVEGSLRRSKGAAPLRLTVAAPVRPVVWGLRLWEVKMTVECDVRLKITGKVTTVLSQNCKVAIDFV